MTEPAAFFTLSRTETVQPYATLTRDAVVELLSRFAPDSVSELAGMDDPALMAAFVTLIDTDPSGLHDDLLELTADHQETLEAGGWRIGSDDPTDVASAPGDDLPAPWEDDADYPMADWRYEVANGDELRGYRAWVAISAARGDRRLEPSGESGLVNSVGR